MIKYAGFLNAWNEEEIAAFVDGCFLHGHDCRNTRPAKNKELLAKKAKTQYET